MGMLASYCSAVYETSRKMKLALAGSVVLAAVYVAGPFVGNRYISKPKDTMEIVKENAVPFGGLAVLMSIVSCIPVLERGRRKSRAEGAEIVEGFSDAICDELKREINRLESIDRNTRKINDVSRDYVATGREWEYN